MLNNLTIKKIINFYNNKPLVVEGANGSIGLSILSVLKEYKINPKPLILTTFNSNLDKDWIKFNSKIIHFKAVSLDYKKKLFKISNLKLPNIIFCSGYGRPKNFLNDPKLVINSNISDLMLYSDINKINSFAFMSSSELYSGLKGSVKENDQLPTIPQHPRGVYIESKRLAESIVENIIGKKTKRYASYRVALAFPPKLLRKDNRVMADLINNALKKGFVTLNGGGSFLRQYQFGPNCVKKILASMAVGKSCLYNNSGPHIVSLKKLALIIGEILNLKVKIKKTNSRNLSAPKSVLINSTLLNSEIKYNNNKEKSFKTYITEMIKKKHV